MRGQAKSETRPANAKGSSRGGAREAEKEKPVSAGNNGKGNTPSPSVNEPIIRVEDLTKEFQTGSEVIKVLRGVNLSVNPGEMLAIMGPSGMGKSTFLFILGLLQPATGGKYMAKGRDVFAMNRSDQARFRRRFAGFVFQSCNLFEHTTVYENLEFPLIYAGVRRKDRDPMIQEALERVNLTHRLHHPANRLSGGEQQRVSIARALVNRPEIIFADEPTGQLDRNHGNLVMDHFHEFIADQQSSMVLVTHDPDVADRCTRVVHLRDGVLHSQAQLAAEEIDRAG
ncbi:MAG: ABC transporter ATP-binding protein [Desulfovibrio sp.]|nr:MAG: ABC transporter ATP-binding protein [Desulfovibrio sp.]